MNTRAPELKALIIIFGFGRARDLDPPVVEVGRRRRDRPGRLADLARRDLEVGSDPGIELDLALLPPAQQVQPGRTEAALQVGDEGQRVRGQDAFGTRDVAAPELHARRQVRHVRHVSRPRDARSPR